MTSIHLIYITLQSFEFIIFIIFGCILSKVKNDKKYWSKAWVPILSYTLIEGLRFGRRTDWNGYFFQYETLGKSLEGLEREPIFSLACNICYNIGIPYFIFVMLLSAFLIISVFIFLKNYRKQMLFMLPMSLVLIMSAENLIRWYFSFSFILLAMNSLINNKTKKSYMWLTCALMTHMGMILFFPIFIFYKYLNKVLFNRKIVLSLFLAMCFIFSVSQFTFIISIAKMLVSMGFGSLAPNLYHYLLEVEYIIKGEFGNLGLNTRSIFGYLRLILTYAPVIWFGGQYVKKYKFGRLFYNIFAIGAVLTPQFLLVEILNRNVFLLVFFLTVTGGIFYYEILVVKAPKSLIVKAVCILSFVFSLSEFTKHYNAYPYDDQKLFIWDARGRETIVYPKDDRS